ncbi:HBS1-like protein [Sitophilus oryzae]|uniref:HBS1-like protein n=1 Tax=Sitophilus oryzae TaxID=7048 RepID=A0A6J2XSF9_SITOR|nr:HBS1-like protein [Sitophilus oryzae]
MARHRDIRNMDYEDEYDAYDDVYGHSVDDDYYISPSNKQFIYNRESSRDSRFEHTEDDIQEVDEIEELSDTDKAKLNSCIDQIKDILGSTLVPRNELVNLIMKYKFNIDLVVNAILEDSRYSKHNGNATEKAGPFVVPTVIEPSTTTSSVWAVASATTSTNIVKGFDVPEKEAETQPKTVDFIQKDRLGGTPRSQSPAGRGQSPASARGQSPASGRGTPLFLSSDGDDVRVSRKDGKIDPEARFKKERGDEKDHLYMVVIGHVDAGKSTLMGRLLCDLGQVNKKTMHKYEQESKKLGKQSFMYAWVLDETGEERNRGITMDVGRYQFETKTKEVTLLDAPGHKDFIPNMISGAGQADVGVLVVDATRGEFETGFDLGGQTREHALLVRSLGVTQLAVVINKLDTVSWSKDRFEEIVQKLKTFLKQAGFKENDVTFVPCSGLTGQNLVKPPTENELLEWYKGPCLLEVIDKFRAPARPITKPFKFSVNDVFKGTGTGFCVAGRVETGVLNTGDKVLVCPNKDLAAVKSLAIEEVSKVVVFAGDQATVTLSGIEMQNVSVGNILCDPGNPVQVSSRFEARIVIFNIAVPITKGYSVVLHHQSLVEPAVISKLTSQLNKSNGEVQKKHPRFLSKNSSAIVEISVSKPIALEVYSECKELGRVMLRVGGATIAAGLVTKVL